MLKLNNAAHTTDGKVCRCLETWKDFERFFFVVFNYKMQFGKKK